MKLLFAFFFVLSSVFVPIRTSSTSTTIAQSDDTGFVTHTGSTATYTLGTVSAGFSCTIENMGIGIITFSQGITVGNGKTLTTLGFSRNTMTPDGFGNSITIHWDGTAWRGK